MMQFRNQLLPIGIDIGSDQIKAAQIFCTRQGVRVLASVNILRHEHQPVPSVDEVSRLSNILTSKGFRGTNVVIGAPRSLTNSAVLDLPPKSSGAPVEHICASEYGRMYRMTPGTYELYTRELPSSNARSSTTQMAVVGLSCDDAVQLVSPFELAGLQVVAIDVPTEATIRAYSTSQICGIAPSELVVILDFGWSGVALAVLRGHQTVYERWLPNTGYESLVQCLSQSLGTSSTDSRILARTIGLQGINGENVDPILLARTITTIREHAESILHDVFGSVSYVLDRYPGDAIKKMYLCGGASRIPMYADYLSEVSGIDVINMNLSECHIPGCRQNAMPHLLTAIGHSLWGATIEYEA